MTRTLGRRAVRGGWTVGLTGLIFASCQEATKMDLVVRTNVPFARGRMVAIAVGPGSAALESFPAVAEVRDAWDVPSGDVGSLALVPANAADAKVAIRVVLADGKSPEECTDASPERCIIARRTMHFIKGLSLRIPITLYSRCFGVPCGPDTTCDVRGECVSAQLAAESCSTAAGCSLPGDPPVGTALQVDDGGARSDAAELNDGAVSFVDGGSSSDGGQKDGGGDAGRDSGPLEPDGIYCGATAGTCTRPTWNTPNCCVDINDSANNFCNDDDGGCGTRRPFECDNAADCPGGQICCHRAAPEQSSFCSLYSSCTGMMAEVFCKFDTLAQDCPAPFTRCIAANPPPFTKCSL